MGQTGRTAGYFNFTCIFLSGGEKKKTRDRRKILTKFKHATEEKIVLLLLLSPVYTDVFSFENGCILMHSVFVHRPHFNARKRR